MLKNDSEEMPARVQVTLSLSIWLMWSKRVVMKKCVVLNMRREKPKWYSVTVTTEMTKKKKKVIFSFHCFL